MWKYNVTKSLYGIKLKLLGTTYFKNDNSKNHEDEIFEISANKTVFLGEFIN